MRKVAGVPGSQPPRLADQPLERVREEAERNHILFILNLTKGRRAQAARMLGITRGCLRNKVRTLGVSIDTRVQVAGEPVEL